MRGGGVEEGDDGYFLLTPPVTQTRQWTVRKGRIEKTGSRLMGLPIGRSTRKTATGFLDGRVASLTAEELNDMRLWKNRAGSADEGY